MKNIRRYISEYGLSLFVITSFTRLMSALKCTQGMLTWYEVNIKRKALLKYQRNHYCCCISDFASSPTERLVAPGDEIPGDEIYVFWAQGVDNAPEIVRACIESIKRHSGGHKVNILSLDNYTEYVDIPPHITAKFHEGKIGLAHFSDVLRFNLINQRGGLWLDSTCFLTSDIPQSVFTSDFFTLRGVFEETLKWDWTSFCFGGTPHNAVTENMCTFYSKYWNEHDIAVTYLILDIHLTVIFEHLHTAMELLKKTPVAGNPFTLITMLHKEYNPTVDATINGLFFLQKLTYRNLPPEIIGSAPTVYGHLIRQQ